MRLFEMPEINRGRYCRGHSRDREGSRVGLDFALRQCLPQHFSPGCSGLRVIELQLPEACHRFQSFESCIGDLSVVEFEFSEFAQFGEFHKSSVSDL